MRLQIEKFYPKIMLATNPNNIKKKKFIDDKHF